MVVVRSGLSVWTIFLMLTPVRACRSAAARRVVERQHLLPHVQAGAGRGQQHHDLPGVVGGPPWSIPSTVRPRLCTI